MRFVATTALCVLGVLMTTSCALKHSASPGTLHYSIGTECHPTADLVGCDSASPPRCAKAAVHYDKGCEKLELK